jgi:hypothetical protein
LKPGQANSSQDPISKKIIKKRAGGVAQGVGPEFKFQYQKKQKKKDSLTLVIHCHPANSLAIAA